MVNSRDKGAKGERDAAGYFRAFGPPWQDARRLVAAGWSNGSTSSPDRGDLTGLPGLCVQVKNMARRLEGKLLADVWAQTCAQARAAGDNPMPLILEKRTGCADVCRWWLWLNTDSYVRLVTGRWGWVAHPHLVRVELGDLVDDLRLYSLEKLPVDTH
jgi:hypothetical protein